MAVLPNKWPVILTAKDWQKKKGPFAKAAGETGVSFYMGGAERCWGYIGFEAMNKPSAVKFPQNKIDDAAIEAKLKEQRDRYEDFIPDAQKMLRSLSQTAIETSAKWKKSKLIPSGAAKHALDVSRAARDLADALSPNSAAMKQITASYEKALRARKNA